MSSFTGEQLHGGSMGGKVGRRQSQRGFIWQYRALQRFKNSSWQCRIELCGLLLLCISCMAAPFLVWWKLPALFGEHAGIIAGALMFLAHMLFGFLHHGHARSWRKIGAAKRIA